MDSRAHINRAEHLLEPQSRQGNETVPPTIAETALAIAHVGVAIQKTLKEGLDEFRQFRRASAGR